ncbi:MAG: saccharopine dehydrogenase NADP-binding domain-containing protein [Nitrospirota bacterium]|nr:saccharopine dehydrogenase NADP-binding domain-containing protein [Nitrospirota bacterium]
MVRNFEFDIVIWGASGFVGRRVAHHMAARYGSGGDLRWAIGGRKQAKLESVRSELGSAGTDIPIVTGDSHDVASLEALAARTKVVCSTVGPYAKYGSELVKACVSTGTHYCDLTGEAHWMRKMIDAHQAEAEKTGARIVHACGFDSIPSDMGVFFLQHKAKERYGIPCSRIKLRVKAMRGGFSGGTLASLIYWMQEGPRDPSIRRVMTEPYSLNPKGQRQGPDRPQSMRAVAVKYDDDLKGWTMPFFMGPINTKIVRRSNALLGYLYGEDFGYEEAILIGSGPVGWVIATIGALGVGGFMLALALPPTRWLLKKFVLPKPGQGPSQRVRENGFFDLILVGKLGEGNVMRARIKGVGDPGTESTSKLLVESAVCLAQDSEKIAVGGGFWTPASAMGELLLLRLTTNQALSFELV